MPMKRDVGSTTLNKALYSSKGIHNLPTFISYASYSLYAMLSFGVEHIVLDQMGVLAGAAIGHGEQRNVIYLRRNGPVV